MKKRNIDPDKFERMLAWLDADREQASRKYLKIRRRMIEILASRGCYQAEFWAHEAIDRIVEKIDKIVPDYQGDPAYCFYGYAKQVIKECIKDENPPYVPPDPPSPEDESREHDCLDDCLKKLPAEDREIILGYYSKDGREKINHRTEMAQKLGIGLNALRIRVYRIRLALKDCIEECLERGET
ncbi:MAG TPA: hypothetical protein VF546_21190 [Pyrinomonadaceae bacterium]